MDFKYSCVVDAEGYYKDLVMVARQTVWKPPEAVPDGDLEPPVMAAPALEWVVQNYTLAEGDRLIDATFPSRKPYAGGAGFLRPRWDDDAETWVEGATAEETAAWEAEHPAPKPGPPTVEERVKRVEAQVGAANDRQEFVEDCIAELAGQVYGV